MRSNTSAIMGGISFPAGEGTGAGPGPEAALWYGVCRVNLSAAMTRVVSVSFMGRILCPGDILWFYM